MKESILISLEPRHAKSILAGGKTVELRRRRPHVAPGTLLWLYSKMPVGCVVGHATIKQIHEDSPARLWRRFGRATGIARDEFFCYFEGREVGVAIELEGTVSLRSPITLQRLRQSDKRFQPPQFFVRLTGGGIAADAFRELALSA